MISRVCLNQQDETVRSVLVPTETAMNVNREIVILGGGQHGKLSEQAEEDKPGYPYCSHKILLLR